MRQTHTYVHLPLSGAAYDEIKAKLLAAGYNHAIFKDGTIDLHGLGAIREKEEPEVSTFDLCKEFFGFLFKVEVSDNDREFRPNHISSCRVMDGKRMNEIITELKGRFA